MAQLRNISTDTLETRVAGRVFVTEPDGLLEVPDAVFLDHVWPGSLWAEVDVPSAPDPDDTVEGIKDAVGSDVALAQAALDAENAKPKPRSTLVTYLESIINDAPEG